MFMLTRRKAMEPETPTSGHLSKSTIALSSLNLIFLMLLLAAREVQSSPPVDYFVYTSQLATSQPQAQRIDSILPSIESIYFPNVNTKQEQELGAKVLELVQNISHTHDNDMVDMETTRYAWHLMERQAQVYMRNRLEAITPFVETLLAEAKVSDGCRSSLNHWLEHLRQLDQWAAVMWNAWGEFPAPGFFEGSFTDLGSYRGCLSVADNELIGQAQYCMLDFQPLVPTRPRFHSIFKKVLDVDTATGQLNSGDFDEASLGSLFSAHGFSASKYYPNMARSLEQSQEVSSNKHNKRTIIQNGTSQQESTTVATGAIESLNRGDLNMTVKSEALVELLRKAQYFYYVKFRLGACLPARCSLGDVQKLAQTAGSRAILQANKVNCMKKEPYHINAYQKVAIWILSVLALVAVLGTIVDVLGFKESASSSALVGWLLPFSIWTNARRLFDSKTAGTHADLECVHGLRFFSMIWVIYGHTILYTEYQSFTHFFNMVETQIPSFILLPTLNANFSVDTFFVISGILTTYVTWEYTQGDARKFNKIAFAISRYVRLTPQLAIVMLCFFLLPLFGDGPMYRQISEQQAGLCYKNWAINLLYLQSYVNSEKLCIDPSWWLSIEMSFHLISMVVIIVMIKSPKRGMLVNFGVAAALTCWGAIIHYTHGFAIQYLPSIPQRYEVTSEQTTLFFHRPYPHAAAYFIGIALGYVLANKTVKKISKVQLWQGWMVCIIGAVISLWGSYYWNLGAPYTQVQSTLYYHLCQILWPLSIAWIIFACSIGHGGIANKILSSKCFVPLGRVTYMTYLSHALIIYYHSASANIPLEPSMLLFIYIFVANTFLSILLGVFLTLLYESPILNLQKQLFSYLTKKFDSTSGERSSSSSSNRVDGGVEPPRSVVFDTKKGSSGLEASMALLPNGKSEHSPTANGTTNNLLSNV